MQLLILLLLAMSGGNPNAFKEVKPLLESLGGGEAAEALKKAEELSGVISAVQALSGAANARKTAARGGFEGGGSEDGNGEKRATSRAEQVGSERFAQHGFPLAPVAAIADEGVTYCLSRYISLGE